MQYLPNQYKYDEKNDSVTIEGHKIYYYSDIISIEGANYHFWLPKLEPLKLAELKFLAKKQARYIGDPISFSYDFIPTKDANKFYINKGIEE